MNNAFLDRMRQSWEDLNDRERRMLSIMALALAAVALLAPPVWLTMRNTDIEAENAELRGVLERLASQRTKLMRLADERQAADKLYLNKTPSLGSFLEAQAKKQGVTLQEVTDQPEKDQGHYLRRSVTVSLPQVGLTPVINLLSSIVESGHPVAVDHIQIDHFQPGDQYNVKLGILTYDKQAVASSNTKKSGKSGSSESDKASE